MSFFSGACVALVVEVLKCWMCEVGSPQYVAVLWKEAGIDLLVCLVMVKKGSYWFLMFSLIAKLRTYCECDHITIMTPCSAKVLLYLKNPKSRNSLVSVRWQGSLMSGRIFSFHFPLWCCCFPHPCCSFFMPDPHLYVCDPGRAHWEAEAEFLSVLSVLLWCRRSRQTPGGCLVGFFSRKAAFIFFHRTIFARFAYFHFRNKPKAEQAWSMVKVAWWCFS